MVAIKVSTDFSGNPHDCISGATFRDSILIRKYEEAERNNDILEINFDDCYGIGTAFLKEAFSELVKMYQKSKVLKRIKIISTEDETIPELIKKYIKDAENEVV